VNLQNARCNDKNSFFLVCDGTKIWSLFLYVRCVLHNWTYCTDWKCTLQLVRNKFIYIRQLHSICIIKIPGPVLLKLFLYAQGLSRWVTFEVFRLSSLYTYPTVLPLLKISVSLLSLSLSLPVTLNTGVTFRWTPSVSKDLRPFGVDFNLERAKGHWKRNVVNTDCVSDRHHVTCRQYVIKSFLLSRLEKQLSF
jgi:hypothetical protein